MQFFLKVRRRVEQLCSLYLQQKMKISFDVHRAEAGGKTKHLDYNVSNAKVRRFLQ